VILPFRSTISTFFLTGRYPKILFAKGNRRDHQRLPRYQDQVELIRTAFSGFGYSFGVVGWTPIRTFRMNNLFNQAKDNASEAGIKKAANDPDVQQDKEETEKKGWVLNCERVRYNCFPENLTGGRCLLVVDDLQVIGYD
jgi:hypothetical protein